MSWFPWFVRRKRYLDMEEAFLVEHQEAVDQHTRADDLALDAADLRGKIHDLVAENERMFEIIHDPRMNELTISREGFAELGITSCLGVKVLAASFAEMILDAPNWRCIEFGPFDSYEGTLVVTVRRRHGKSPEFMLDEAKNLIKDMREDIASFIRFNRGRDFPISYELIVRADAMLETTTPKKD